MKLFGGDTLQDPGGDDTPQIITEGKPDEAKSKKKTEKEEAKENRVYLESVCKVSNNILL